MHYPKTSAAWKSRLGLTLGSGYVVMPTAGLNRFSNALTAVGVWLDDGQVVRIVVEKR